MHTLLEDLRCGLRVWRGSPVLALTAILTLALGIAANTVVFGWIEKVLLDPIPGVTRGSELATLETLSPTGELQNTSYRDYRDYRDSLRQVSGLAASLVNVFTLGAEPGSRLVWGEFVSANYFSVMGVTAARGRVFLPAEAGDAPGGPRVVVISDRLWESAFQRNPQVVGQTLNLNQREMTVVGVMPPEFHGTIPGLVLEMWVPVSLAPEMNGQGPWLLENRDERQMWLTARLRPDVTLEQAHAEVAATARQIAENNPAASRGFSATLLPIWRGHLGAQQLLRVPLQILMAACLLLFLIVGANVANLQLARAAVRRKEFSIRLALGARPGRLVRQLLTESLLLAIIGAGVGVLLAVWASPALVWLLPPTKLPFDLSAKMNGHILPFVILLCVTAAVLTGTAPALHALRGNLVAQLKDSARGTSQGAGARRTRSLLVAAEVALAMVALVGTGVLIQTFYELRALDSGMNSHNVVCAKYHVATFCRTNQERREFSRRLAARLRMAPGVEVVSYSNFIPLEFGDGPQETIRVEGYVPAANESMLTRTSSVSPGYFLTLGIPLVEGRDFREQDTTETAPVTIVNQTFARRFLNGGNVLGRKVHVNGRAYTVIGQVRDSKYFRLTEAPTPFFYTASPQRSGGEFWMAFFVRTTGPSLGNVPALRREAAAVSQATSGSDFIPYEASIRAALYPQRVAATLVGIVGTICLLLAAIGLYGLLAFVVSQRTQEFGIRMALGARPRHVLSAMLRQGLALTLVGIAAGVLIAVVLIRAASQSLPDLRFEDPRIFAGAISLLALVGLLASYLPARRATKVDPVVSLRRE